MDEASATAWPGSTVPLTVWATRFSCRGGPGAEAAVPDGRTSISHGAVSPDGVRVAGPGQGNSVWVAELDPDGSAGAPSTWPMEGLHHYGPEVLGWLDDDTMPLGSHDNETSSLRQHLHTLDVNTGAAAEISIAVPGWTGAAIIGVSVAGAGRARVLARLLCWHDLSRRTTRPERRRRHHPADRAGERARSTC